MVEKCPFITHFELSPFHVNSYTFKHWISFVEWLGVPINKPKAIGVFEGDTLKIVKFLAQNNPLSQILSYKILTMMIQYNEPTTGETHLMGR